MTSAARSVPHDGLTPVSEPWDLDERSYGAVLAAIALLLVFVHWDALALGLPAFGSDSSLFYPLERDFSRWLQEGVFPHWSDRYLSGQPVSAEGNFGLFHPLRLVLLRFADVRGEGIWITLHQLLAALGMAAYTRALGRSNLACAMAALAFPLCGFFVGHTIHPNMLAAASWVPVLFLCVEKIVRGAGVHWVALLAAASGLQYLSSHPQMALLSAYGTGLYAFLRCMLFPARADAPRRASPLILVAVGLALGFGIAAIQILPMLEVLELTGRVSEPEYRFSSSGSLPGYALLLLIFPAIFGTEGASDVDEFWMSDAGGVWGAWEFHCYAGALIVFFAVHGGLRSRSDALCRSQLFLVVFAVVFAIGRFTPVHGLLWHLPGLNAGRVPSRALLFVNIGTIALAAAGLDDLARRGRAARRRWLLAACSATAAVAAVWAGLVIDLRASGSLLAAVFEQRLNDPADVALALARAQAATSATSTVVIFNGCLLVASAAMGLGWLDRARRRVFALALLGLLAVDLLWFGATFGVRSAERRDAHEPPAYLNELDASNRFFALIEWNEARRATWAEFRDALPTQLSAAWGIDTPDGNTGMSPKHYTRSLFGPLRDKSLTGSERLDRAHRLVLRLRILGVGAVSARPQWGALPWPLLYHSDAVNIWQVPAPLPRAFFSDRRDLAEPTWLDALTAPEPEPADLTRLVALTDSVVGSVVKQAPANPQDVTFDVEAPASGTFVRTTRNVAGWRAFDNGEEVPIRTAVGFFQGVELSPGHHRLRFTFESPGLKEGAALSSMSVTLALALVAVGLRGRPRRRVRRRDLTGESDSPSAGTTCAGRV